MSAAAVLNPEDVKLTVGGEAKPLPAGKRIVIFRRENASPTLFASLPTKKTSMRPKRIRLGVIHSPLLQLRKPIAVEISRKKDSVIATASEFNEFGCGETMSDAIDDLAKGVAELYFRLEIDAPRLGKDLRALRTKLSKFVVRRPTK
jgi:hypothetical protein